VQQKDAQFQKHLPLLFMHANRITDSHKEAYKASSVSKYCPPSLTVFL
jgi:hypothetical protein